MTKHKWYKEIHAWADGAEIEISYYKEHDVDVWFDTDEPLWSLDNSYQYRIKPQPKEPQYLYISQGHDGKPDISFLDHQGCIGKIKLEVDDE